MPEPPSDLLTRPVTEAAAGLGLTLLDQAHAARARVEDPADAEALHDFRVALRRLRSTLRSFHGELDEVVPRKLRNRLRDLARATAAARDAEVLITRVEALVAELGRSRRGGVPWFLSRLRDQRNRGYEEIRREVAPEFQRLERRLRKVLAIAARPRGTADPDGVTLGDRVAALVAEQAAVLEREIVAVQSARDDATAHGARITAKRLRYLLEPLAEGTPAAAAAVAALKDLQTRLGDLHDFQVLATRLGDAVAEAAVVRARRLHHLSLAGDAGPRATEGRSPRAAITGLIALARLVHEAQEKAFQHFATEWRAESETALWAGLTALNTALARSPSAPLPPPPPRAPRSRLPRSRNRVVT